MKKLVFNHNICRCIHSRHIRQPPPPGPRLIFLVILDNNYNQLRSPEPEKVKRTMKIRSIKLWKITSR